MISRPQPLVLGVLGGIGCGKSAVAQSLSNYFQTLILDADKVGHEVLTLPHVREQIRQRFGDEVLTESGAVNRRALAAKVFGTTPEQQLALQDLNSLVHPEIRSQLLQQIANVEPGVEVIVLDAAVMLEAHWDGACDAYIFIDTPFETRLKRVMQRGWNEDELRRREATQLSLDEKRRRADVIIDNSHELNDAVKELVAFIDQRRRTSQQSLDTPT